MSDERFVTPTKWRPILVVLGVVGTGLAAWALALRPAREGASVNLTPPRAAAEVGGAGSPRFNTLMTEKNLQEAERAALEGGSYAPSVVGRNERADLDIRPTPRRTQPDCPAPAVQAPRVSAQAMGQAMARLLAAVDLKPQQAVALTARKEGVPVAASPGQLRPPLPEGLKSGVLLYAANDLRVSSALPNVPVIATVVAGPLKGARLTGRFQVADERLVIQFTSLALHGVQHNVDALAIDPAIPAGDLATEVDHHYLLRWGSLMAGSFLEGLGAAARAIADSGQSYAMAPGAMVVVKPEIDLDKQARITAGTMGQRVGTVLQQNFNTPTTVTVAPGQEMGVLILKAE